ncbi:MAG: hypothetical protein LBR25_06995 [Erysipelotrichaceae bacterium]|nr:hypothetical protein [Erysipelotrichaceae bacterium]
MPMDTGITRPLEDFKNYYEDMLALADNVSVPVFLSCEGKEGYVFSSMETYQLMLDQFRLEVIRSENELPDYNLDEFLRAVGQVD